MTADDLTEDAVIERYCTQLELDGWLVRQRVPSSGKGIDIVATRKGAILYAEAKGAVGAKSGMRLNSYQATCSALMQTCAIRNLNSEARVAMVLPDTEFYRFQVASIKGPLDAARIEALLVDITGSVRDAKTATEPLQWSLKTLPTFADG